MTPENSTPATGALASAVATYSAAMLAEVGKNFPRAAVESGVLYGPAVGRMALKEFAAYVQLLNQKKLVEAQAAARAGMTVEELTDEKASLTPVLAQMANDRADGLDLFSLII